MDMSSDIPASHSSSKFLNTVLFFFLSIRMLLPSVASVIIWVLAALFLSFNHLYTWFLYLERLYTLLTAAWSSISFYTQYKVLCYAHAGQPNPV